MRFDLQKICHFEVAKTYLSMLDQAEIEQCQFDGRINKKLYNRIIAYDHARKNNFKKCSQNYTLNNYAQKCLSQQLLQPASLESFTGNDVQQNVHKEIVSIVNRYSYLVHVSESENTCDGCLLKPDLYEAVVVAMSLNKKLNGTQKSFWTKAYERTYSFLDFCHNLLKVNVGRTALFVLQRVGMGASEGIEDFRKLLQNGITNFVSHGAWRPSGDELGFESDSLLGFLNQEKGLEAIFKQQHCEQEDLKDVFGDEPLDFYQDIKEVPMAEIVGDGIQFLTRKLVFASAIIATTAFFINVVQTGVAAATTISSTIAAGRNLGPLITKLTGEGAATIEYTAAGTSILSTIATVCGQAAQALAGWLEPIAMFCCAAGDGDNHPSTPVGRRGKPLNTLGTNSAKTINGRVFSGHALDRMQGRGLTPSVIENAIEKGKKFPGNTPNTTVCIFENVKVIINESGNVITVIPQ